ncbi:GPP34 family phosphoprotein [Phytomonospora sp. NPDC050363]|uniref:GOLPH3/VPS74 family protein n=1 Tax=Phytomonospora sp. NPDC050363 TaxID=3155642 RepID=UPI0033CED16B
MISLGLAEELTLIAYDDATGRNRATSLELGVAGALLLELAQRERIALEGKKVAVVDASPIGYAFADEALAVIGADKPRSAQAWVNKLSKGLLPRVREGLVEAGVLREEKHKFLGVIPYRYYPAVDMAAENQARERLTRAAGNGVASDARTAALAGLVRATSLHKAALPGMSGSAARKAIKAVAENGWASEATRKAIEATQAAVMAAVMASVTASAAASSGGG